jgi:hypothetical protein
MILCKSKKFIYIHCLKTAGTSIGYCLSRVCSKQDVIIGYDNKGEFCEKSPFYRKKHLSMSELMDIKPGLDYKKYFKFGFCRNPFELAVSAFYFFKTWKLPAEQQPFASINYKRQEAMKGMDFNDFISSEWYQRIPTIHSMLFKDGKPIVDFIGRFENIDADFNFIKNKICLNEDIQLSHKNKTSRPMDIRKIYSSTSKRIVEEKNAKDLEYFKYEY